MQAQLSIPQWLSIPHDVRVRIAQEFNLKKSTGRIVDDNVVKSDGHTHDDLLALNVESLQAYLGSNDDDLYHLVEELVVRLTPEPVVAPKVDLQAQHLARLKLNVEELQRQALNLGLKTEFNDFLAQLASNAGSTHNVQSHQEEVQATEVQSRPSGRKKATSTR